MMKVRTGGITASALVIGGALAAVAPRHGPSIVQLIVATTAAAAALQALSGTLGWTLDGKGSTWWSSSFHRSPWRNRASEGRPTAQYRVEMAGPRQPEPAEHPLPSGVIRTLTYLIVAALHRRGLDVKNPAHMRTAQELLSSLTWQVLNVQHNHSEATMRSDETGVALAVHTVLDDLDAITGAPTTQQSHRGDK